MRLYAGSSQQFITDSVHNQIADKLKLAFFEYFRHNPSPGELNSWRNSLRAISQVFQYANLLDHGVILEYQLPLTSKRLDCLICGTDAEGSDRAVIIELKQWEKCVPSEGENEVLTWVGGAHRDVLHPSAQVGQYLTYLEDTHTAFQGDGSVALHACTYLHNHHAMESDPLFATKFTGIVERFPLYTADDVDSLKDFLHGRLGGGNGLTVLKKIEESKYRPSKKLMDHVGQIVKAKLTGTEAKMLGSLAKDYTLIDEQLIVYDKILNMVRRGFVDHKKNVVIIKGGPGTGKSVVALKLLADLNSKGFNAQYATGSKSFTETLRKIVGTKASAQFKYFLSYVEAEPNAIDVLIMDEAHRIREKTVLRMRKSSGDAQINELLRAGKVCVFFIDEDQIVRPGEIGSIELIKSYAEKFGAVIHEHELDAQFRCNGSDAFVNWINNTLGVKRTANVIWDLHEEFDFKIFHSPQELDDAIRKKVSGGSTGRVTAGYCWDWHPPKPDGLLIEDVVIGDYRRPWNAHFEAKKLAAGIPKTSLWAYEAGGIDQVGCIYTAQGFEFDYVGVIFGKDLRFDLETGTWVADKTHCADATLKRAKTNEDFLKYVKNVYRVLLTRGMKGCYVCFLDKETEQFFRSRFEA